MGKQKDPPGEVLASLSELEDVLTDISGSLKAWPDSDLLDQELVIAQQRTQVKALQIGGKKGLNQAVEKAFDEFVESHITAANDLDAKLTPLLADGFKTYRKQFLKTFAAALDGSTKPEVVAQVESVLTRVRDLIDALESQAERIDMKTHVAAVMQAIWASSVASCDLAGLAAGYTVSGLSIPHAMYCVQEALTHFGVFKKAK
jgi:hypothetical protein